MPDPTRGSVDSVFGEHRVDLLARPLEDLEHAFDLFLIAGSLYLRRPDDELANRVAEIADTAIAASGDLPRSTPRGLDPLRRFLATRFGDLESTLAVAFYRPDQPLVFEQLQRRVTRTSSRDAGS